MSNAANTVAKLWTVRFIERDASGTEQILDGRYGLYTCKAKAQIAADTCGRGAFVSGY
jgi:hypothetical protein